MYTEIIPGVLFLGSAKDAKSFNFRILDLTLSKKSQRLEDQSRITYIPIKDKAAIPNFISVMDQCVEVIDNAIKMSTPILVHCLAGSNRSAAVVAYFLLLRKPEGRNFGQVHKYLQQLRPCVSIILQVQSQFNNPHSYTLPTRIFCDEDDVSCSVRRKLNFDNTLLIVE